MKYKSLVIKARWWFIIPVIMFGVVSVLATLRGDQSARLVREPQKTSHDRDVSATELTSTNKFSQPLEGGRRREPRLKTLERKGGSAPASEFNLSDALLTDSILSIVQSYYVDPGRVDNAGLLATALSALGTNPRIRSGSESGTLWVEIDGERRDIQVGDSLRYQDLIDAFEDIAQLLDAAGIDVALGDAPEKNASGRVVLLNSMLAELDAHSSLLSPDAYRELRQGTEGSFGGLGVLVGIRNNLLTVIKPLPRSPALRAGIKKYDKILGIDGVSTFGYTLEQLVEYMRGDPGTQVQLLLLREGERSPSALSLKREVIQVDSVAVNEIQRDGLRVLHLTVENFSSRTSMEVMSAIKKSRLRNNGVLHGLVLDLRSNPGGLLDQAVQVADLFLQSGVIVTTKGRREEIESAGSGFDELNFPIAVLINGDSASASEIVAGALQDHGRAVVIGQPSFGKGSVQTIFELPGERALKLTIARYYTPGGRSIQNVGIIPDVWLQPLFKRKENENLLGPYRYKNERFLRNHLEAGEATARPNDIARIPARKAYYLVDPRNEDDDVPLGDDQEMNLALKMIGKIKHVYGDKLPASASRASHWLGLAGPEIGAETERLASQVKAWLGKNWRLTWEESKARDEARLELGLSSSNPRAAIPGETIKLDWKITSREPSTVGRVSIFVRSDHVGLETKEVLIGAIEPGAPRHGSLDVQIPSYFEPGPLLLRIGLAVDAWPARNEAAAADWQVQIEPRAVANLQASLELIEEKGGQIPHVLESAEQAKLRLHLRNDGPITAQNVTAHLANLAGLQVDVQDLSQAVDRIEPGEKISIDWAVSGGKALVTSEVAFGLSIDSADLKNPLRQRFSVKASPAGDKEKISNLMSH